MPSLQSLQSQMKGSQLRITVPVRAKGNRQQLAKAVRESRNRLQCHTYSRGHDSRLRAPADVCFWMEMEKFGEQLIWEKLLKAARWAHKWCQCGLPRAFLPCIWPIRSGTSMHVNRFCAVQLERGRSQEICPLLGRPWLSNKAEQGLARLWIGPLCPAALTHTLTHSLGCQLLRRHQRKVKGSFYALCSSAGALKEADRSPNMASVCRAEMNSSGSTSTAQAWKPQPLPALPATISSPKHLTLEQKSQFADSLG